MTQLDIIDNKVDNIKYLITKIKKQDNGYKKAMLELRKALLDLEKDGPSNRRYLIELQKK